MFGCFLGDKGSFLDQFLRSQKRAFFGGCPWWTTSPALPASSASMAGTDADDAGDAGDVVP